MTTLVSIVLLVLAGGVIYLATLDGRYEVRRRRLINTNIDTLFDKIRDFKSWPEWSPWLMHEPDCQLKYSDNYDQEGGFYEWDGERVGAGKLSHVKFDRPGRIEEKIEFVRPFKSVCDVTFEFEEKGPQTEITWIMQGEMPFLVRFMTKKTAWMISKDYDLGLAMLAGIIDSNDEHPRINFEGDATLETTQTLCHSFAGGVEAMVQAMESTFPNLAAQLDKASQEPAGRPMTAYHKVNPEKMEFECDFCVPVKQALEAGDFKLKTLAGGRYFKSTLQGSYEFLELAWYSSMAHLRMRKIKQDGSRPAIEVYENDPNGTSSTNNLLTSIYIPIK